MNHKDAALIGTLLAMTGGENLLSMDNRPEIPILPPAAPKPPTGTREYFFNAEGEFSTSSMRKTECVYMCYAINDKNAKRKFEKWKTK